MIDDIEVAVAQYNDKGIRLQRWPRHVSTYENLARLRASVSSDRGVLVIGCGVLVVLSSSAGDEGPQSASYEANPRAAVEDPYPVRVVRPTRLSSCD